MASVLARVPAAAQQSGIPLVQCAEQRPRYRRSTTCRAPRKRSFIANMEKAWPARCNETLLANSVLCASNAAIVPMCTGGDDNGCNGGRAGGNGGKRFGNGGSGADGSGAANSGMPRLLAAAVIGVSVYVAGLSMASPASASPNGTQPAWVALASTTVSGMVGRREAAQATNDNTMRPRSRVMHIPVNGGGTLVVPMSSGSSSLAGSPPNARVMDSPIQLTDTEYRILADRQFKVRETYRI